MDIVAWLLIVVGGYAAALALLVAVIVVKDAMLAFSRVADRRHDADRRRRIAECERDEIQEHYRRLLDRASINLAWQLPPTLNCPEEERR